MTRKEQAMFVNELTTNVAASVIRMIEIGDIPEHWDGHQFRRLLRDRFADAVITKDRAIERRYRNDKRAACIE